MGRGGGVELYYEMCKQLSYIPRCTDLIGRTSETESAV